MKQFSINSSKRNEAVCLCHRLASEVHNLLDSGHFDGAQRWREMRQIQVKLNKTIKAIQETK